MDNRLEVEFLGDGAADRGPGPGRRLLAGWRLPSPGGWTGPRRVAAAVAGAALLVGAGTTAARLLPDQPLPTVVVDSATSDSLDSLPVVPWRAGADGRPATAVTLALTPMVARSVVPGAESAAGAEVRVLGLAGPGVTANEAPPTAVPAGPHAVAAPVRARIDCTQVPETIPDGAYGLRVQARFGSRHQNGIATHPVVGRSWADRVSSACSAWTARRTLTITQLEARPRPGRSALDVSFTVANTGERGATLTDLPILGRSSEPSGALTVEGRLPVRIPPLGSATTTLTLQVGDCGLASPAGPEPALSDLVGLAASTGADRPAPSDDPSGALESSSGVVLAAPAAAALHQGLVTACGGIEPPTLSVPAGGVRRGTEPNEIVLDVDVRTAPGRVRSLRLEPDLGAETYLEGTDTLGSDSELVKLMPLTAVRTAVPDASGRARITLQLEPERFDLPCSRVVLSLSVVAVTARILDGGAERDLRYWLPVDVEKQAFEPLVCRRDR